MSGRYDTDAVLEGIKAGLNPEELAWAESLVSKTRIPDGMFVSTVIMGYDPDRVVYIHYRRLSAHELMNYSVWSDSELVLDGPTPGFSELRFMVKRSWPEVEVFEFGCTCCSTEDLVEWNDIHVFRRWFAWVWSSAKRSLPHLHSSKAVA